MLLVFPPLGFSSLGLGISFGGVVPVPVPGGVVGWPLTIVAAPQGSQVGPQPQCFFEPQRAFRLSKRFGRHEMLVGQHGAGGTARSRRRRGRGRSGHGGRTRRSRGAAACDFLQKPPHPPIRDLRRSKIPTLGAYQHPTDRGAPQSPHPAPLTTNGAAGGGGGGAASAPASTADDMIRNAAFTATTLLRSRFRRSRVTTHQTHRRVRKANVKPTCSESANPFLTCEGSHRSNPVRGRCRDGRSSRV